MNTARFHDEARLEFLDSVAYYEAIQAGLGERFRMAIEAAVALAVAMPMAGSAYRHGTRRVFSRKFPYAVIYKVEAHGIVVFAVAHCRRKPGYWTARQAR